jgi:hypothetical protein
VSASSSLSSRRAMTGGGLTAGFAGVEGAACGARRGRRVLREALEERVAVVGRGGRRGRAREPRRRLHLLRARAVVQRLLLAFGLRDQVGQRIGRDRRIQVEHEPVLVGAHRRQREHLRFHRPFRSNTIRTTCG